MLIDAGRSSQATTATAILGGLDAIEAEIAAGTFPFRDEFEDIHMNVEARLRELIGEPSGRLHTARIRNDQVASTSACGSATPATASVDQLQAPAARPAGPGRDSTPAT